MRKTDKRRTSYIVLDSHVHGTRRPLIKGTRITVDDVLSYISAGWSASEISHQLKIPKDAVLEALAFVSKVVREINVIG